MKRRRVFIGIDVPPDMGKRLAAIIAQRFSDVPIVLGKNDNLHLTLHFIGYVDDDDVAEICAAVRARCQTLPLFDVQFTRIALGPESEKVKNDPREAKMVWLSGPVNEELMLLQRHVVQTLDQFPKDRKAFRPHITLGRIRARAWKETHPVSRSEENVHILLPVNAVTIYESVADGRRHRHVPLEVCPLNG